MCLDSSQPHIRMKFIPLVKLYKLYTSYKRNTKLKRRLVRNEPRTNHHRKNHVLWDHTQLKPGERETESRHLELTASQSFWNISDSPAARSCFGNDAASNMGAAEVLALRPAGKNRFSINPLLRKGTARSPRHTGTSSVFATKKVPVCYEGSFGGLDRWAAAMTQESLPSMFWKKNR